MSSSPLLGKVRPPTPPPTGAFDRLLRTGRSTMHGLIMVPVYLIASLIMGAALAPGIVVFRWFVAVAAGSSPFSEALATGVGVAAGFFTYGFALLFIVPLVNAPLLGHLKPARGPYHSAKFLPWYLHNCLAYIVRYTFLDFATPTPLNHLYFTLMGMKIGKNAQVNTANISDAAFLTIEADVTIGGSATIIAHYAQGGYLILAPTIIRRGATIGLLATILADVEIGEGAKILPNSVVLPKTRVPAGETWGGVPAKKIEV